MAKAKQQQYDNSSIEMLEGEDRVRKRPAVIFGSDAELQPGDMVKVYINDAFDYDLVGKMEE